ncbi:hypothetical protein [Persephonella sp.]
MKNSFIGVILSICLFFFSSFSADIAVVTNKALSVSSISKEDLKKIYLKIKIFLKGQKVIPVNLPPNSPLRKVFQEKILEMDSEQLNLYWNEMYFHGIEPPLVLSSEKAVIRFVKKVKGAIGYVRLENVDKDLKIIYIIRER